MYKNIIELSVPIIQGGMGIGVSLGNLAGSVANYGGMGVISSVNVGYREKDFETNSKEANSRAFRKEIRKARKLSNGKGKVAVNIMVATSLYEEMIKIAVEEKVDAIISGAGLPMNLPVFTKGTKTLAAPIVSSGKAAMLLCKIWDKRYNTIPDFLVIEGFQAGGHLGFKREDLENGTAKNLEKLLVEVLEAIVPYEEKYKRKIPAFVAGGVYDGKDMAHFMSLGASGVQIATRFIATKECDASQGYKQVMVNAKEKDIVLVKSPVGMPGRAVRSPLIEQIEQGIKFPAKFCNNCIKVCEKGEKIPYCISKALIDAVNGVWETGLFFCGTNAFKIKEICSVKEVMDEIMNMYRKEINQ
jgi:NAD(P)H-dependent flavin oxidoreductase YrpB (nitropropane dioxygenase family)